MIKILLDQNIPALIEPWLQNIAEETAEITSTRSVGFQRMTDEELFYFCQQQGMVLITYDEDFQNPRVIPNIPGFGVVRLNVYPTGFRQTRDALERLLDPYQRGHEFYKPNCNNSDIQYHEMPLRSDSN